MKATAISSRDKINKKMEEDIRFMFDMIEKFLSKLINRCPATMLADSRTDSVIGRMMFLVISIITMKFIRGEGVPVGRR